jgi:hypothetical protein
LKARATDNEMARVLISMFVFPFLQFAVVIDEQKLI